jgi:hypothetical protein
VEQFEILSKNYCGGILVYNEDDAEVKRVSSATNPVD